MALQTFGIDFFLYFRVVKPSLSKSKARATHTFAYGSQYFQQQSSDNTNKMSRFINVEYGDKQFMYGFNDVAVSGATQNKCLQWNTERRDKQVESCHVHMLTTADVMCRIKMR
jgi:hypothetical protein